MTRRPLQQPPSFRSSVDLIAVDVHVHDGDGCPVPGVRPDEFIVTLDGRPRTGVHSADFETGAAANTPAPTRPRPQPVFSNGAELNPASIAFNWEYGGRICKTLFEGVGRPFVVGFPVTDRSPEVVNWSNSPCFPPYGHTAAVYHTHGRHGNDGPSGQGAQGGDILVTFTQRIPGFVATPTDGTAEKKCRNQGSQANIWKYQANPDAEWNSLHPVMLIQQTVVGCAPGIANVLGWNERGNAECHSCFAVTHGT